jgi:hypothetical protein
MSGASNFDHILKNFNKTAQTDRRKDSIKASTGNQKDNELDFLQEDLQWASIQKYNNYL